MGEVRQENIISPIFTNLMLSKSKQTRLLIYNDVKVFLRENADACYGAIWFEEIISQQRVMCLRSNVFT